MIDGIEISNHYFDASVSYVLIKVDIGKMPPQAARNYIARFRSDTALCKELDEREIRYDLVGVRDNSSGVSIEPKHDEVTMDTEVKIEPKVRATRGSKVEKLPGGQDLGAMDDMSYFRQNFMTALAKTNTKKAEDSKPKNGKVMANRNELLKVDSELKMDSFAEAMKLME